MRIAMCIASLVLGMATPAFAGPPNVSTNPADGGITVKKAYDLADHVFEMVSRLERDYRQYDDSQLARRVAELERVQGELASAIEALQGRVGVNEADIAGLKDAMSDIAERVGDLERRVAELERRADTGDRRDDGQDSRLDQLAQNSANEGCFGGGYALGGLDLGPAIPNVLAPANGTGMGGLTFGCEGPRSSSAISAGGGLFNTNGNTFDLMLSHLWHVGNGPVSIGLAYGGVFERYAIGENGVPVNQHLARFGGVKAGPRMSVRLTPATASGSLDLLLGADIRVGQLWTVYDGNSATIGVPLTAGLEYRAFMF